MITAPFREGGPELPITLSAHGSSQNFNFRVFSLVFRESALFRQADKKSSPLLLFPLVFAKKTAKINRRKLLIISTVSIFHLYLIE